MTELDEIGYGKKHLSGKAALEKYKRAKARYPDGIIALDDLDCGHWTVSVYQNDIEKEEFLRKKMSEMLRRFRLPFAK